MRDQEAEDELKRKGLTAPRVTPGMVQSVIVEEKFIVTPSGRTTICELTLRNGFTVRGESSCVSIENFDAAVGRKYAREDAENKIWPLLGFLLAEQLYTAAPNLPSYQQRVVQERAELDEKLEKLYAFLNTETFRTLEAQEQVRLQWQATAMDTYSTVLGQRIAAFT